MAIFDKENNKIYIDHNDYVVLTKMNHIVELQYMEKRNTQATVKKLSKTHFVVLKTGEVKEFKISEHRGQSASSLRKTFKKLRYLINNNFIGNYNELFLTLTYKDNMTDTKQLYDDFRKFIQRLKYQLSDYGKIEYIDVIEPQKRGAWHHHVLIKFPDKRSVFIPNNILSDIWGHGFVKVNRIDNIDNIGAYLTAYLVDIPLDDTNGDVGDVGDVVEKVVNGTTKKFIKGGRLYLYPSGVNLFRKSKGIIYPDRKVMKYHSAKKIVGDAALSLETSKFLDIDDYQNHLKFEQYNMRKKGDYKNDN